MKIKSVGIKGFRGYSSPIEVEFSDLLVLVGKNDIGKSTILEALDIFFNEGKGSIKLDKDDINKRNSANGDDCIEIWVEFEELPGSIVIDASNQTTLEAEYLLTANQTLKVIKRYQKAGKEKVLIEAHHPTATGCRDLLLKKNSELKQILHNKSLECPDKTKNSELRQAIWQGQDDLQLQEVEIEVAKIDAKNIWEQLKAYMPLYSLFQADRKNSDGDSEVQDPMRLAVKEILGDPSIQAQLNQVASTVKSRLDDVAAQTLIKLGELNSEIASSLNPQLTDTESLKWGDVFKNVAIAGDDEIPINKRGSGVKRLILISFFRAEAERRQRESGLPSVVYAIEEPETSQHPDHQRALTAALISLSKAPRTQIVLTTHSPEIVKQLQFDDLLLIAGQAAQDIRRVRQSELPYPSLNEVNFAAFGESTYEYHNELYGFIEAEGKLGAFRAGQSTMAYKKLNRDGSIVEMQIALTEYVRHQIHHPENTANRRFSAEELHQSIELMRSFIQANR
ncbi:ATP-binding protein [Algiphilus sp. NNCM1]|uniref:ATP-binding protein n=1 Tax=Algiphilus sp. TaxID=1872431 RepID=UPI001CA64C66|nr:ATP-binding protein [Algiphilus sp.]MBY8967078.1 ATP-binding protein [Algiphilus acroporae]MCI5062624.1 ATP-binding protein [Algiphilus sp.]MCI5102258.1 ATP-binding protein [Algiphilus sp.]